MLKIPQIKLLELMKSSKILEYNTNAQKSVALLYRNNEQTKNEIKKTITFIIISRRMKYLGTNLTNKAKDL